MRNLPLTFDCMYFQKGKHPIYRLRSPKEYECISVGESIIGNELPTEFGNAGTQVLVGTHMCNIENIIDKYSLTNMTTS